jgi:hypothetical protein
MVSDAFPETITIPVPPFLILNVLPTIPTAVGKVMVSPERALIVPSVGSAV